MVVNDVSVVAVTETREIVFLDVSAGRLLVFAIFKVSTHDPVEPIINLLGLFFGINKQEPFSDQVFTPREFVATRADKLFTSRAIKEETRHVTFVGEAAETEPVKATPAIRPTTNVELTNR